MQQKAVSHEDATLPRTGPATDRTALVPVTLVAAPTAVPPTAEEYLAARAADALATTAAEAAHTTSHIEIPEAADFSACWKKPALITGATVKLLAMTKADIETVLAEGNSLDVKLKGDICCCSLLC